MKRISFIFFFFLFLFLSFCAVWGAEVSGPEIRQGILDLRNWDVQRYPLFELHGQWEFFWKELIRPDDLTNRSLASTGFIAAPRGWNGQKVGDTLIPLAGYATYRLKILLPEEKSVIGFRLSEMNSAYEFWINGKLMAQGGRVAKDARTYIKDSQPRVFYFQPVKDTLEILIPVCNYEDWTGGMVRKVKFGTQSAVSLEQERERTMEMLLFGIFFISGFYHLWFYILRRKDSYHLFFGLLCFEFSLKTLFEGTKIWFYFFPGFDADIYLKIWFINYFLLIPTVIAFLKTFYPKEFPSPIRRIFFCIAILFSIVVLIFPQSVTVYVLNIYHLVTITGAVVGVSGLVLAFIRKRQFALLVLCPGLFLVAGAINDVLFGMNIIHTGFLSQFCLIGFIFCESIIISSRSAKAFEANEMMMHDLERLINVRTRELMTEKNKLEQQNELMLLELDMARKIQQQMIPKADPACIASLYQPMKQVGGDFYDFIYFQDKNKLGVFLSDVSGHGVPAAFVTSLIKSAIQQPGEIDDPAKFLLNLNEFLLDNTAGNFVTAFYGILDLSKRTMVYSNAGHNAPYILTPDDHFLLNSNKKGIPLGILGKADLHLNGKIYQNEEIVLKKKTKILFYTDGLTEAGNLKGDLDFEHGRLQEVLVQIKTQKPKRFVELLYESLIEFRGSDSFEDDVCAICLEV